MSAKLWAMLIGLSGDMQLVFDAALLFSLLWLIFYLLDEAFSRLLLRGARYRAATWRFALIMAACIIGFHSAPAVWCKNIFRNILLPDTPSILAMEKHIGNTLAAISLLWLGYAAFRLIHYIIRRCKTANCMRFLTDAPPDDVFVKATREMGISPICRVWNGTESIAVFGIFKPIMIVSADFTERYTEHERYCLYLHELTHIRRHDTLFNFFADIWDIVFWIFPPLKLEMRRQREYKELCCDAEVLKHTTVEPISYGELLLREIKASNNSLFVGFSSGRYMQAKLRLNAAIGNIKGLSRKSLLLYLFAGALLAIQLYTPPPNLIENKIVVVMSDESTEVLDLENSDGEAYYQNSEDLIAAVYADYDEHSVKQISLVYPNFVWEGLFGYYMRSDNDWLLPK